MFDSLQKYLMINDQTFPIIENIKLVVGEGEVGQWMEKNNKTIAWGDKVGL